MRKIVMTSVLMLCLVGMMAVEAGTIVTMAKRGNIRYGPHLKAGVIVTLKPGTEVEVLGHAEGQAGWYKIRFPRQGRAWMHSRNLEVTDREGILKVTYDGASVRSDSRITAEKVAEMELGETVEWSGLRNGEWYAVYAPGAVAYVYKSVLNLTATKRQEVVAKQHQDSEIEGVWKHAKKAYEAYIAAFQNDAHDALTLNWKGLSEKLTRVVDEHPDLRTRLLAQKLKSNIKRVVQASESIPVAQRREMPELPPGSAVVAAQPKQPANAEKPALVPTAPEKVAAETTQKQLLKRPRQQLTLFLNLSPML